jgi:Aromatic-ring-opening dioxygenase LigAB, LigA subunit
MSEYQMNKLLFESGRRHTIVESLDESELARYELTTEERHALKAGDIKRLYELGANPYLLRRVFRPRFHI